MKYFLRISSVLVFACVAFGVARAARNLYPAAENVVAASGLEQALYRLMPLPAGSVLARRAPSESRAQIDSLMKQSAATAELYSVRAQEDERQLAFDRAEKDWQQAANLSNQKQTALLDLADFYHRRLQPQDEVRVLLQSAVLPAPAADAYKIDSQQTAWLTFRRAVQVCADSNLSAETRGTTYQAWIGRYPKDSEPLAEYFDSLIKAKDSTAAAVVAVRIRSAFPGNVALKLETDSRLAELERGKAAALSVYDREFSPLWPTELRAGYYTRLSDAHLLRAFVSSARADSSAHPLSLDPVYRIFFYYEQQGKRDLADQQLLDLQARRLAAQSAWSADELKTVGGLYLRVTDYDEAAHAYYALYALAGVSPPDKSLALASLIDLLLDVPEQPLQFGTRDLSMYRNIATMDRHPGFLNGILSLLLNTTFPADQYQAVSQTSVAYFHRAMAERLLERVNREFPRSPLAASRQAKLFSAYSVYGQNDVIIRLVPAWMAANGDSSEYTKVALLLADSYVQEKQITREFALYDGLLKKLAEASDHRPLGEASEANTVPARSPDYAQVLGLYISRLTELGRLTDAVALYRHEIDRNPADPGIYERLALFVEQNHLDSELEQTYRAAMKRFDGSSWPVKLARFYLRQRQTAAYEDLAKQLTAKLDGLDLAQFISAVRPDPSFSIMVYRQINLYAHQRFPHNLTFVRNLLASYQAKGFVDTAAYEALLRENWFYDPGLRTSFFEYLSRTGKLDAELSALPPPDQAVQQKNKAALTFYAEGKAWLAEFENAGPAFVALDGLAPGDRESSARAVSIERSLAASVPGAFDTAVRLAVQQANAAPADASAATLVGEIYADRDLFAQAAPWWNKVVAIRPGVSESYLDSATVFWDYFQFSDALRIIDGGRRAASDPSLYAYEAGVIHENGNDYRGAIDEYLNSSESMSEARLIQLARRRPTTAEIERRTSELAAATPFSPTAFRLRLAVLESQERRQDIRALLSASLERLSDVDQVALIQANSERLGFEDVTAAALQRVIALSDDPVEKLAARLSLAHFYQAHRDLTRAANELASLLAENPNLLGIIRSNVDFYWSEKESAKAIATLESATSRASPSYRDRFLREASRKATESADFPTARRLLDLLLAADPYNGDLLAAKAETYARSGDNKALTGFYAAELAGMKASPLSSEAKTQRSAGLRRGYINALIISKQFGDALEQYELLLNGYPEDESLAREVARFAEANQLADRLTGYYEKATADSPRDYRWPTVLSRIDKSLRRYPEALAALDKAVYVRPDRLDLFIVKADLETRLLRFDAALKTYQRLYDLSYHDSQYLASQASLHARLGHQAEAVRLLKSAYVDTHPNELNGYAEVMSALESWRMYSDADQVYQLAKPFIRRINGDYQRIAKLEGQTLVALRRPVEALEEIAAVRRVTSDPKDPWSLQPVTEAMGTTLDDLYTPEEKASFALKLETPKAIPAEFNVYDLARFGGFTELTAKRLYRSALARPLPNWQTLQHLQSSRLLNDELGRQLEAIKSAVRPAQADAVSAAALAAYARAGDSTNELRLYRAQLANGAPLPDPERFARLLLASRDDLSKEISHLSAVNPAAANQLVQELLTGLSEKKSLDVIAARGVNISSLWTHSYSALTALYLSSPRAAAEFDVVLGPRTVGSQLAPANGDAARGAVWYYYAARYADYLTAAKNSAAQDLQPAIVEANPIASDSYVGLGDAYVDSGQFSAALKAYEQALELSPGRADVYVLMAQAEHASNHRPQALEHLRSAFESLTQQADKSRQSPQYYETAKLALTRMNEYNGATELRPSANAMLTANMKHNQSFQFLSFTEGILTHAADRQAALEWLSQLALRPELTGLTELLLEANLLTEAEKKPIYLLDIDRKSADVVKTAGEAKQQALDALQRALSSYTGYLNNQGSSEEAWQAINEIEPKNARPGPLLLELAAKTGRLTDVFSQYDAGTLDRPAAEQILSLAAGLKRGYPDLSRRIREYEYLRELRTGDANAAAYLGLAEVRLDQQRTSDALTLLREVTLGVGSPFENYAPAIALLEKAGLKQNAADYAREWQTAEPWNPEANLALGRLTQDKARLEALRTSEEAAYSLRAAAANVVRDMNSPKPGAMELDLLTRQNISAEEASQPFFVLARLRAAQLTHDVLIKERLYGESVALKPSLLSQRLALAEAAFANKQDALGLATWQSYDTPNDGIAWLHASPLDEAMTPDVDRTFLVEELVADAFTRQQQYNEAETMYDRLLQQATEPTSIGRIKKLKDSVVRAAQLDQLNRSRAPMISNDLAQTRIVKPKLSGGRE